MNVFVYTILAYIAIYMTYQPSAVMSFLCVPAVYWVNRQGAVTRADRREMCFSVCMGILIALSIVWGKNLVEYDSTRVLSPDTILRIAALSPACINLMKKFFTANFSLHEKEGVEINAKKSFIICWIVIFAFYLPVLWAFYPGLVTYDVYGQTAEIFSGQYNLKHPFAHTMFMGVIFKAVYWLSGNWNTSVFAHSLIQMLIMSGTFSYICSWIYKHSKSKKLLILTAAFFAVLPIHSLLSIATTKDVLFGAIVSVVVIKLAESGMADVFEGGVVKRIVFFTILFFAMFIFRNNAVYAGALFLPFLLMVKNGRRIIIAMMAAAVALFLYYLFLHNCVQATDGPRAEMYSVPVQQMARVYNLYNEDLPKEDKEALESLIVGGADALFEYKSRKSDDIKDRLDYSVLVHNRGKYISLWAKWGGGIREYIWMRG